MEYMEFLMRIAIAFVAGAAIGVERQWRQRMAGLRTNTLVSTGAALFVLISAVAVDEVSPTRVAAQVVSGIGFIGAGVIMKEGLNIRGLNTAATLWCSAAVGALAGTGQTVLALVGAGSVLAANLGLRHLQRIIDRQPQEMSEIETHYEIHLTCRTEDEIPLRKLLLDSLDKSLFRIQSLHSEDSERPGRLEVIADLSTIGRKDDLIEPAIARLCTEPGVSSIRWKAVP